MDDLRDRIAAVIRNHGTPIGLDTGETDEFDCCAQAIIDDLGLTVEERTAREPVPSRKFGKTQWDNRIVTLNRIVGRWEEE